MSNYFEKCHHCRERRVGCHSECEYYIDAVESQQNDRDERLARNRLESYSFDQNTRKRKWANMLEENIRLGMVSIFTPITLEKEEAYIGKIIYIHPQKRFYTVELELGNGCKVRECFDFPRKKMRIPPIDRSRMPN